MASSQGRQTLLVHFGMLLATLAFASWWTSHTILDSARTRRVANAVLENTNVRHYVSDTVASVTASSVGAPALTRANAPATKTAIAQRLDAVLGQRDIRIKLEDFVTDAHDVLIGKATGPAVLDAHTTRLLVSAAMPQLTLADLSKVNAVRFSVPRYGALVTSRNTLAHRFVWYLLGALVLLTAAIALSQDRHGTMKLIGKWLIGISVAHLLILWFVPVIVLPHISHSPWVGLASAVAGALTAGIVVGLIVLAAAGIAFLLADRFVVPAPVRAGEVAESTTGS